MAGTGSSDAGGKKTIVEEGTNFTGSMMSTCPIVVRGRIEGDIEAPGLYISTTGAVRGRAKVGEVQSEGEVSGEIDAETVQLAGKVMDNTVIRAKSLEVRLHGADEAKQITFGNCQLSVGETPTDDPPVAEKAKKKG